jgi:DHA2 family multidrug resistance protein
VASQGTRRFWFDADVIVWSTVASIAAWSGFAFLFRWSPLSIIEIGALRKRRFGVPILLNLYFRAGLVVTAYLVPVFLATVQGYRPLQQSSLLAWMLVPQLLAFPLAWRALHLVDSRAVIATGLVLCGAGTALAIGNTNLVGGEHFHATLVLFGLGQTLFLVPTLVVGAMSLEPRELPTASIVFNVTTLGGGVLGTGLLSHVVTEREKFHSNVIAEGVSIHQAIDAGRVAALSEAVGSHVADGTLASLRAVALTASQARREAWVLAFNDGFALVAVALVAGALAAVAIGRCAPLVRWNTEPGDTP